MAVIPGMGFKKLKHVKPDIGIYIGKKHSS
jgi:hypothetical protein